MGRAFLTYWFYLPHSEYELFNKENLKWYIVFSEQWTRVSKINPIRTTLRESELFIPSRTDSNTLLLVFLLIFV